jgi:hypothetical protein
MNVILESPKVKFTDFFVEIFIYQVHMLCQTSRKQKSRKIWQNLSIPNSFDFHGFL